MFFQTLKVISQDYIPFPSDSASWNITTYLFGDCNPLMGDNCQYTDKFIVKGDTMIDNEKYTKLYLVSGTTIDNLTYLGGFREDSTKKVFYRGDIFFDSYVCDSMINDTTEILLYDFGLSIGDSIKNINFKCAKELVYDIDSVEYAGKKRKRFTIQRYGAINDNYWIEGVGSTKGLFYPLLNWFEWDWELTCFEDNIQDWSASECVTTGIENINTSINAFNIYPNPMIYESIIEWDENILNPDLIVVYSIMGKKILSIKPVTNSIILKKSTFVNSGLYIVNLITDKENIIKRLIVE
jgi:hypothetical protein